MPKRKRDATWNDNVLAAMEKFAHNFQFVYSKKDREISAYFEIGCLLSLVELYEKCGFKCEPRNLGEDGSYKYLTSPNGNPSNFSYLSMTKNLEKIQIRQQVRIVSHIGDNVSFTPDITVIPENAVIGERKDIDYANGKRKFFFVDSANVIAAHECKSMVPFPELLVSFIGIFIAGHKWVEMGHFEKLISRNGNHLAPCLFVGGNARAIHLKMIAGLKKAYPLNIVAGMHSGTWNLFSENAETCKINNPLMHESSEVEDILEGEGLTLTDPLNF